MSKQQSRAIDKALATASFVDKSFSDLKSRDLKLVAYGFTLGTRYMAGLFGCISKKSVEIAERDVKRFKIERKPRPRRKRAS